LAERHLAAPERILQFAERPEAISAVIASEAKQSSFAASRKLDCFVASLLAMTGEESRIYAPSTSLCILPP
jgi:hypothetical protein